MRSESIDPKLRVRALQSALYTREHRGQEASKAHVRAPLRAGTSARPGGRSHRTLLALSAFAAAFSIF